MPSWLLNLVLPYAIQALTPILVEYIKKADLWILSHLPKGSIAAVAGVVGEIVNQAQAYLTGHPLPYGMSGTIAMIINSIGNDFGKEPPTPGVV